MNIVVVKPGTADYWNWMGPAFADRNISKEIGAPIYAESEDLWFIGFDETGTDVQAFSALRHNRGKTALVHDYVYPRFRRQGRYREIADVRENAAAEIGQPSEIRVGHTFQTRIYEEQGFSIAGSRGRFTILYKDRATHE